MLQIFTYDRTYLIIFFSSISKQAIVLFYLFLNVLSIHRYNSVLRKLLEQMFHQTQILSWCFKNSFSFKKYIDLKKWSLLRCVVLTSSLRRNLTNSFFCCNVTMRSYINFSNFFRIFFYYLSKWLQLHEIHQVSRRDFQFFL